MICTKEFQKTPELIFLGLSIGTILPVATVSRGEIVREENTIQGAAYITAWL